VLVVDAGWVPTQKRPPEAGAGNNGTSRERFRVGRRGYPNVLRSYYNSDEIMTSQRRFEYPYPREPSCC